MAKVQCRNCDEYGHTGRDCPKPTDWSRVECSNCHEKGHTYRRCTKPPPENEGGEWDDGNAGGTTAGAANGNAGGDWQDGGHGAADNNAAGDSWGAAAAPAVVAGGGW